ncbi:RNA-binding protein [Alphaproteobacteria bacterium]|jgi:uncharacterized protein|nr:RNA-binding protein [Alphaproteobacteria bacterium]
MERFEAENLLSVPSTHRQCIVTGDTLPCAQMVRFVTSPDGCITPDLQQKLPGRGLWVTANHDLIRQAVARKQFARAARASVEVSDDLPERVSALLHRQFFNLLGLVRKAGGIVLGSAKVISAVEKKQAFLVLHAADGSIDERGKIDRLAHHCQIETRSVSLVAELSAALGKENVVHCAIIDKGWANRLSDTCDRIIRYQPKEETRII